MDISNTEERADLPANTQATREAVWASRGVYKRTDSG